MSAARASSKPVSNRGKAAFGLDRQRSEDARRHSSRSEIRLPRSARSDAPPRRRAASLASLWHTDPQARYALLPTRDAEETDVQLPVRGGPDQQEGGDQQSEGVERLRSQALEFLERSEVQIGSALIILLNALVIGAETDYPDWRGWDYVENTFLGVFTVELLARVIIITPTTYFACKDNPELMWNLFDVVVVSLGLVDFAVVMFAPAAGSLGFASVFRIIRLCRILRIFKIIRFLKQLYLLAYGFVEAALAIVWVTILMTFILYVCGIVLARVYGHVPQEDPDFVFLTAHFGTVPGSMLTLFELMSQPDLHSYEEVLNNRPSMLPFLIAFIIFGSFGMIALLTGVISESMFEKNKAKMEEDRLEREQRRNKFSRKCQEVFQSIDSLGSGNVTVEELRVNRSSIIDLLDSAGVDLPESSIDNMMNALDCDLSGTIDCQEFENGVMQMCEDIRPMSIMELHSAIRKCQKQMEDCHHGVGCKIEAIDTRMDEFASTLGLIYEATVVGRPPTNQEGVQEEVAVDVDSEIDTTVSTGEAAVSQGPPCAPPRSGPPSPCSRRPSAVAAPERAEAADAGSGTAGPSALQPPQGSEAPPAVAASVAELVPELQPSAPNHGQLAPAPAVEPEKADPATFCEGVAPPSCRSHTSETPQTPSLVVEGHSTESSPGSKSADDVLEDFRKRLEELAQQVRMEVQHAEAASGRMGELMALQAEHTARLGTCSSALNKVSVLATACPTPGGLGAEQPGASAG